MGVGELGRTLLGICSFCWVLTAAMGLWIYEALKALFVCRCCRPPLDLKGKRILITGSGSGIGRALALQLAEYRPVLILWSKVAATNAETRELIEAEHGEGVIDIHVFNIDVGNMGQVQAAAKEITESLGPIDVLINNAGTVVGRSITLLNESDIRGTIQTNLLAHFWRIIETIKAFLPGMMAENSGHILAISSVAGIVGSAKVTDYSASKFGVVGMMESLDIELRNGGYDGIALTTVSPYFVNSGLFEGIETRYHAVLPIVTPEEVAERTIRALHTREDFIFIPKTLYLMLACKGLMPSRVLQFLGYAFGAHTAMNTFKGRDTPV